MANTNAPMPTYFTPFLKEDGRINEPWYRFLFQLQQRTGGSAGHDFQAEIDALTKVVASQDLEINGLYPSAPVLQDFLDSGAVQVFPSQDIGDGYVPIPTGTLGQQNSDSVAITGGSIDGTSIGSTIPSSGSFTTVQASSTITPSQTAGIVGTNTNNNANAGSIGEYITQSATPTLTSGTVTNITSISLSAGDWDVFGNIEYQPSAGVTLTQAFTSISSISATHQGAPGRALNNYTAGPGLFQTQFAPVIRFSLSTTTTIFLVGTSTFSGGALSASGYIRARRIR